MRTRIAIVWASGFVRESIQLLLSQTSHSVEVVAQGDNSEGFAEIYARCRPDAVLFDTEALGMTPTATVRTVKAAAPHSRLIAVSAIGGSVHRAQILEAGASSFLTFDATSHELVEAVRGKSKEQGTPLPALSYRESQVVGLMAQARSNKEIAKELFIAEGTVKRHVGNIFQKLGARSRLDAVQRVQAMQGS